MSELPERFRAFIVEDGRRRLGELTPTDLPDGEVSIRVAWSSVNYKDALASTPGGRVARISPLVPGIDLAGQVIASTTPEVAAGAQVLAHGYDLGVAHHGGYAAYARVPAGWVVPLPEGLDARQAMILGTAGFTAALSIHRLQEHGLDPDAGPVLVTGASGGVGSLAVAMLAKLGHQVTASSGKAAAHDWLRGLGASEVVGRDEVIGDARKPLASQRWAAAVDCVGGATLAGVLRGLRYGAAAAASGNTGGAELATSVLPFILRAVALLGVDSAQTPIAQRRLLWRRLAGDLRPPDLDSLAHELTLDDLDHALDRILGGQAQGRMIVRLT